MRGGLVCTPPSSIVDDGRFQGQCDVLALTDADKDVKSAAKDPASDATMVSLGLSTIAVVAVMFC